MFFSSDHHQPETQYTTSRQSSEFDYTPNGCFNTTDKINERYNDETNSYGSCSSIGDSLTENSNDASDSAQNNLSGRYLVCPQMPFNEESPIVDYDSYSEGRQTEYYTMPSLSVLNEELSSHDPISINTPVTSNEIFSLSRDACATESGAVLDNSTQVLQELAPFRPPRSIDDQLHLNNPHEERNESNHFSQEIGDFNGTENVTESEDLSMLVGSRKDTSQLLNSRQELEDFESITPESDGQNPLEQEQHSPVAFQQRQATPGTMPQVTSGCFQPRRGEDETASLSQQRPIPPVCFPRSATPANLQTRAATPEGFQQGHGFPGSSQLTQDEQRSLQPRPCTSGSSQTRPATQGSCQLPPSTLVSFQPRSASQQSFQTRPGTSSSFQPRPASHQSCQPRPGTLDSFQPRPASQRSCQPRPGTSSSFQTRPASQQSCQARPGTSGTSQRRQTTQESVQPRRGTSGNSQPRQATQQSFQLRPGKSGKSQSHQVTPESF